MQHRYPTPQEIGIAIPGHLIEQRFCSGFLHALKGGQIRKARELRLSFREGYRAGKLYLRELRRQKGILSFPAQGRVKFKNVA
ncbi:MAG TPA: hypothetical protein ENI99_00245 [Sedimenticola sp.]|nr:hypothetical protein [Sedimenticola sp.]